MQANENSVAKKIIKNKDSGKNSSTAIDTVDPSNTNNYNTVDLSNTNNYNKELGGNKVS